MDAQRSIKYNRRWQSRNIRLNRDEQNINPAGYTEYTNSSGETKTWISSSQLKDEKIEAIYAQDPVKYMYWPIFQVNLNANPELKNYSWYN